MIKNRFGCYGFGFWFDEKEIEDDFILGRYFVLLLILVKVYYGSIIKDDNILLVIFVEEFNFGWLGGYVMYVFIDKYCLRFDEMFNVF